MMEERQKKLKWIQFVKKDGEESSNEKTVSSCLVSIESMENAHYLPWRYTSNISQCCCFLDLWNFKFELFYLGPVLFNFFPKCLFL